MLLRKDPALQTSAIVEYLADKCSSRTSNDSEISDVFKKLGLLLKIESIFAERFLQNNGFTRLVEIASKTGNTFSNTAVIYQFYFFFLNFEINITAKKLELFEKSALELLSSIALYITAIESLSNSAVLQTWLLSLLKPRSPEKPISVKNATESSKILLILCEYQADSAEIFVANTRGDGLFEALSGLIKCSMSTFESTDKVNNLYI